MMGDTPFDPVDFILHMDVEKIRDRLEQNRRERSALLLLLRAAQRAEKPKKTPPPGKGQA